jgi:formylglycine-generating enzyme required for sulfatase activity
MGSNPSSFSSNPASGEVQENRPVEYVSWYDALVFCNKLSMAEGLTPAYRINNSTDPAEWGTVPTSNNATWNAVTIVSGSTGYRLPTEAQWEYAAKGGNNSPGNYTYAGSNTVDEVAWYGNNSGSTTHEVGKKKASGLGLYDMSGNVWEWCWDWYGSYTSETQTDPTGAASGSDRVVLRGGGWYGSASNARSVARSINYPRYRSDGFGFRLVRP